MKVEDKVFIESTRYVTNGGTKWSKIPIRRQNKLAKSSIPKTKVFPASMMLQL